MMRTHEDTEKRQEDGGTPMQKADTGDNVGVQKVEEVEPALLHSAESVDNSKLESVREIQHPPHEDEQEI